MPPEPSPPPKTPVTETDHITGTPHVVGCTRIPGTPGSCSGLLDGVREWCAVWSQHTMYALWNERTTVWGSKFYVVTLASVGGECPQNGAFPPGGEREDREPDGCNGPADSVRTA